VSKPVTITEVHVYPIANPADASNQFPVACPMAMHLEYQADRSLWRDDFGPLFVRIETDAGIEGIGYSSMGSLMAAVSIRLHLRKLLVGEDARLVERLSDIMIRSTYHQGRDGYLMHGISAVDLALWDIKGKLAGEPVCTLLGGPVQRDGLPCYMTGYDADKVIRENFLGLKVPLKYGPASGQAGFDRNVAEVAALRQKLGPDRFLSLDCWMGLDVPYTLALARAVAPYKVKWIEEPLVAGDLSGYRELRAKWDTDVLIATGEHEALVRGAEPFMRDRLADIWQADVTWAGGITEMKKIAGLALASGTRIVPHYGYTPWAAHFILACQASPMIEWYDMTADLPGDAPLFVSDMPLVNGRLLPGSSPGFGITMNWDAVELNLDRRIAFAGG
jgi:L-rhamnonate dehydratase